jgi:hypothetical protein
LAASEEEEDPLTVETESQRIYGNNKECICAVCKTPFTYGHKRQGIWIWNNSYICGICEESSTYADLPKTDKYIHVNEHSY